MRESFRADRSQLLPALPATAFSRRLEHVVGVRVIERDFLLLEMGEGSHLKVEEGAAIIMKSV